MHMNSNISSTFSDGFYVGEIVWAKRSHDGIYWPGRITFISDNLSNTLSINNNLQCQLWSYFIQFFENNQSNWTVDVLPYRQYRDYMSKNLFIHYDSYPQIKYQLLNAINQADYAHNNEKSNSIKLDNSTSIYSYKTNHNYNSIATACQNSIPYTTNEYPLNYYSEYASNYPSNTQLSSNNYWLHCTQSSCPSRNQLSVETNTNSIKQFNNEYQQIQNDSIDPPTENFQKTTSVIIVTTKLLSNSSFISYLFNCISNFFYHSIIYIDDLMNYQHPNTSNIYYLIYFDYFNSTIKQILNSTILNNLNANINYLFFIINSPSYELIKHLYSIIMNKRSILILHYHYSTFNNESLLLCSGNRTTFEMIRLKFLKYLCSNIKYIESNENENEQLYSTANNSFEYQSNNIKNEPIMEISSQPLESRNHQSTANQRLPISSVIKYKKKLGQRKIVNNLNKKIHRRKLKQYLPKKRLTSASSSEYYVQNILDSCNSSK